MYDVAVTSLATGPVNLNAPVTITATIDNPGLSTMSSVMTIWRCFSAIWRIHSIWVCSRHILP
jgi:hypothetical protein